MLCNLLISFISVAGTICLFLGKPKLITLADALCNPTPRTQLENLPGGASLLKPLSSMMNPNRQALMTI
jgi:hypothetical protein